MSLKITKDNFNSEVKNSDKPVLLDFWAEWCPPCKMIAPTIDELAGELDDVKVGKVNIDEQPEIASAFGVMSIPTLIVVSGGKVVNQAVGVKPKAAILQLLGK